MRAAVLGLVLWGLLASSLGLVPTSTLSDAAATVPTPGPNEAVISVKVGGDRLPGGSVAGLQGVTLGLYGPGTANSFTGTINPNVTFSGPVSQGNAGTRYNAAWSWTTCTSDANGDCNFVIPLRAGAISSTGVPQDTRFWVVQESTPSGWYANPQLRVGDNTAGPEWTWDYRFRTDTQLRPGQTYRSTTPLAGDGDWFDAAEPDRAFMRNAEDDWAEGDYPNNIGRTTGIWSESRTNPPLPRQCGLKIALVTDTSGSLGTSGMAAVKSAMDQFVDAFRGTPTQMSLFSFSTVSPGVNATNAPALLPVTTTAQAAAFKAQYGGWTYGGGTNWDRGLAAAANSGNTYDIAVLLTDGNPTTTGTSPGANASAINSFGNVDAGIFSANQLKAMGTRVLAVGAGPALTIASELNLRAVSGVTEDSDYFRAPDFATAAGILAALATANCQGNIKVQKLIVPLGGTVANATPAPAGWQFGANGIATGVSVVAPNSVTTTAGANGIVNFGLSFTSPTTSGGVRILETQQSGYAVYPVSGRNATCVNSDTNAAVAVTNAGTAANPGFDVTAQTKAQIECKIYNTPVPPGVLVVKKSSNPPTGSSLAPGSSATYTLSFQNTGGSPVQVNHDDVLTDVVDDANVSGITTSNPALTAVRNGDVIDITGSVPAGATYTVTYTVTVPNPVKPGGNAVLNNYLIPDGGTPPTSCVPSTELCTTHPISDAVTLDKAPGTVTGPDANGDYTAKYTVTVKNNLPSTATTYGALRDTPAFDSNLTPISASWTVTATTGSAPAGGSATGSGPYTLAPASTTIAGGATHTYAVAIKFRFTGSGTPSACGSTPGTGLFNTATLAASPAQSDTACDEPPTRYDVFLHKVGKDASGTTVSLTGSAWQLQTDNAGSPGTVVTGGVQAVSGGVGEFKMSGLPAGTYWLTETTAPSGHTLLAEPIRFVVSATGVVTVTGGASSGVSVGATATGDPQITVGDPRAVTLPLAGGSGTRSFALGGGALIILALLSAVFFRRRAGSGASTGKRTRR